MKSSFKICFFLPVWGRPEVTRICFEGLKRLTKYYPNSMVHAVVSEDDMSDLCNDYGFTWTFYKNEPLGEKVNAGLAGALEYDWDYFTQLGADDLIANQVLDIYLPLMEKGWDYFGLNRIGFISSETKEALNMKTDTAFGLGRTISRKALEDSAKAVKVKSLTNFVSQNFHMIQGTEKWLPERIAEGMAVERIAGPKWRLWEDSLEQCLDNNSNWTIEMIAGHRFNLIQVDEVLLLDIKGPENIGKFETYNKPYRKSTKGEVLKNFPERELIEAL